MKRTRIGLLVETPEMVGGIQAAARRHARLLGGGFDVVPIAFETSRAEKDWGGRIERLPGRAGYRIVAADLKSDNALEAGASDEHHRRDMRYRSFADRLIEVAARERLDVLHAFGLFHQRGLLAAYAAAKRGIPYLLSFRGVDLESRIFDEKSLPGIHAALLGAQAVVCVSSDSEALLKRLFRPACPTYVIRNHFDPSMFSDAPADVPLLRGNRLPVIGCFGKFRRVTGLDFLLRAFDRVNRRRPAVLLLGGTFQKREAAYYNACLEGLAAAANVLRVGQIPHERMPGYLRLCDVVAFPSVSDASPNKVLEAMHAGAPIVASAVGGIPELVRDGRDALLAPPRDERALADALSRLLTDRPLARRLAASARKRVLAEFAAEREAPLWREVYRRTLEDFRCP